MSRRPPYSDMVSNFQVLRVELERCFGELRRVPSSTELRALKRTDLEKVRDRTLGPRHLITLLKFFLPP